MLTRTAAAKPMAATAADPRANMSRWFGPAVRPDQTGMSEPTSRGNVNAAIAPGARRAIWAPVAAAGTSPKRRPPASAGPRLRLWPSVASSP